MNQDQKAFSATCPLTSSQVIERYFLEHRAKLLDLAAFLDRIDRSADAPAGRDDYRIRQLNQALALVAHGNGERARRVLELLSDPTTDPIDQAPGKGAAGAYEGQAG